MHLLICVISETSVDKEMFLSTLVDKQQVRLQWGRRGTLAYCNERKRAIANLAVRLQ